MEVTNDDCSCWFVHALQTINYIRGSIDYLKSSFFCRFYMYGCIFFLVQTISDLSPFRIHSSILFNHSSQVIVGYHAQITGSFQRDWN